MAVQHKTTKKNQWTAWSGELEDLRRLGQSFTELVSKHGVALLASYEESHAHEWPETSERQKKEFEDRWRAFAELRDGDDQIEGAVDEVLAELDRRSAVSLELSATSAYTALCGEEIKLVFHRNAVRYAVSLEVKSGDQGWARQVLTLLSEQIEKGVPKRWAWCRTPWGHSAIGTAVFAVAYVLVQILLPSSLTLLPRTLIATGISLLLEVIVLLKGVLDWFFPPFEVTSRAGSSGGRRLAGLGLLLLSVPIGILVNLLTG